MRGGFLFDGNGRGQALDVIDVRLLHYRQELARVGRQRFDIAALALGIDRVEGQRRLAGPGQAGDRRSTCPAAGPGRCFSGCGCAPRGFEWCPCLAICWPANLLIYGVCNDSKEENPTVKQTGQNSAVMSPAELAGGTFTFKRLRPAHAGLVHDPAGIRPVCGQPQGRDTGTDRAGDRRLWRDPGAVADSGRAAVRPHRPKTGDHRRAVAVRRGQRPRRPGAIPSTSLSWAVPCRAPARSRRLSWR